MVEKKKIRFAVIGFGHIGKRHAEEISNNPDAELLAICDTDSEARRRAAALYNISLYDDTDTLLRSVQADVINICTPNGYHAPLAKKALLNGTHVLIEKPMALHKADCDELIALAGKQGRQIFCVLQNRYSPPSQFINSLIKENRLGRIFWVQINCFWNRDERYYTPGSWRGTKELDGGPLYTQFSHFIDLLYWNFGPLKNIKGIFSNCNHPLQKGLEDTGSFSFEIEKGGSGVFNYSTALRNKNMESSITIIGEKGTVKAGGQYMDRIEYFDVEGMEMPVLGASNPPNQYGSYTGSAANHHLVIDNIVKALRGEAYDIASAAEAAGSVEIIEEVYKIRDREGELII
jgi:predicted dehydrogenase